MDGEDESGGMKEELGFRAQGGAQGVGWWRLRRMATALGDEHTEENPAARRRYSSRDLGHRCASPDLGHNEDEGGGRQRSSSVGMATGGEHEVNTGDEDGGRGAGGGKRRS